MPKKTKVKKQRESSGIINFVKKTDNLEKKYGLMKILETSLPVLLLVSSMVLASSAWIAINTEEKDSDLSSLPITGGETELASMYFSNTTLDITNESTTMIDIMIDTGSVQVDGADLVLKYDPNFIEISNINDGTFFPSYPLKDEDFSNNTILVTGLSDFDTPESGYGTFVSVMIKAKKTGTTQLEIVAANGIATDSNVVSTETSEDILSTGDYITLNIE